MECDPASSALVVYIAWPLPLRTTCPKVLAPSNNVTLPVGVLMPPLLTVAVIITGCPYCDGLLFDISVVVEFAVKLISSTGCSSMPFGATPVCPWMKSKNPTPFICTGTFAVWKLDVADNRPSNLARALAIAAPNGQIGRAHV